MAASKTAHYLRVRYAVKRTLAGRIAVMHLAGSVLNVSRAQYVAIGTALLAARSRVQAMQVARAYIRDHDVVAEARFVEAWQAIHDPKLSAFAKLFSDKYRDTRRAALISQRDQSPRVTYTLLVEQGISLRFVDEYRDSLAQLYRQQPDRFLFTSIDNWKAFKSPTFGSTAPANYVHIFIHDLIDHMLIIYLQTVKQYRGNATMRELYSGLHARLGNPLTTNYPELKGEPWAHPGHAWRESHLPYASAMSVSYDALERILTTSAHMTSNQSRVLHELNTLHASGNNDQTIATLCFMYEACTEVMRYQGILYGPLYELDDQQNVRGEFPLYDPEYLCFVFDTLMLCNTYTAIVENAIDVTHIMLECYLREIVQGKSPRTLTIHIDDLLRDASSFAKPALFRKVQALRWHTADWTKRSLAY